MTCMSVDNVVYIYIFRMILVLNSLIRLPLHVCLYPTQEYVDFLIVLKSPSVDLKFCYKHLIYFVLIVRAVLMQYLISVVCH